MTDLRKELPPDEIQTVWHCGCVTWAEDKRFHIDPCAYGCAVYLAVLRESAKRGNLIVPTAVREHEALGIGPCQDEERSDRRSNGGG